MAVRSTPLRGAVLTVGATHAVLVDAPAGRTKIIKALTVMNRGAVARSAELHWNDTVSGALFMKIPVAAGASVHLETFIVLSGESGDTVYASGPDGSVQLMAWGADLAGEPS